MSHTLLSQCSPFLFGVFSEVSLVSQCPLAACSGVPGPPCSRPTGNPSIVAHSTTTPDPCSAAQPALIIQRWTHHRLLSQMSHCLTSEKVLDWPACERHFISPSSQLTLSDATEHIHVCTRVVKSKSLLRGKSLKV